MFSSSNHGSGCFLCEQDAVWSSALEDILTEQGIAFYTQAVFGAGLSAYVGPIMERTQFFVAEADLDHAQEILRSFFSEAETDAQEEEAEDDVIRLAQESDLERIAEIEVFNYRQNFYPIFKNDEFYFQEFCVSARMHAHRENLDSLWVFDDGAVKGFVQVQGREIIKLFVEPILHGQGIGAKLLEFAAGELGAEFLWALEKNVRAIAFYKRHGFCLTGERKNEEDTEEFLVCMERKTGA